MSRPPPPSSAEWQGRIDFPPESAEADPAFQGAVPLNAEILALGETVSDAAEDWGHTDIRPALQSTGPGWLGWGLIGVSGLGLIELGIGLWHSWQTSWVWGGLWSAAWLAVAFGAGRVLWQEVRELYQLKYRERDRALVPALLAKNEPDGARAFCEQLARHTGMQRTPEYQQWRDECELHHTATEQLEHYSLRVLSAQDVRAQACISRWSGEAAVLVAISPLAMVDMLLILWRSLKMIDEVADCYGIRLGYGSRIRLLRQIGRHMLYAGAAELITDVGLDWLGAEVTAKLSARLAQGVGAGLLTARLGLQTMQMCRPIPFRPGQSPRLGAIRKELLGLLGSKLGGLINPSRPAEPLAADTIRNKDN